MKESVSQSPYYFQEAIQKFSKAILCVFDLSELVKLMLTAVTEIFEVNKASILLKDKQSLEYRVKTFRGFKKDIANKIKLKGEKGIADWLRREGRILRKEDLFTEEPSSEHFSIIKELDMLGAYLCVPLSIHDELIAIISLGKKATGEKFTSEDIRLLVIMANYAAVSIYNAFLYQQVFSQRNYYQTIIDNISTGVITVDNDGKIITLNNAGKNILRLEKTNIINEDIQKVDPAVADIMLRTLKRKESYYRHEVSYRYRDIPLGLSTALLKNKKEEIIGGAMVFSDLSKVKDIEKKKEGRVSWFPLLCQEKGQGDELKFLFNIVFVL